METEQDIRWKQRFNNYSKALERLLQAVNVLQHDELDEDYEEMMTELLIHRFEITHELSWKVMKDFAEYHGHSEIFGSRDAIRKALELGIIKDDRWLKTIQTRNATSHRYDESMVAEVKASILDIYSSLMVEFRNKMQSLIEE